MANKRTILVTGVAGFIGSNFLNFMVKKYPSYSFIGVDSLTSIANKDNIEVWGKKNFIFFKCDIRDRVELKKIFHDNAITDVIHLAAETHVDLSIKNPILFSEVNVNGTNNLLYLSHKYGLKRFHHISTDEVYGALQKEDAPFTEESPLQPNNPYSASKAGAEFFVRAYHKTFGMDTVVTRCSNNYGPRQDATKLIPLFLKKLLAGEKVPLYGRGAQMREWLYVDDHVRGLDLVFHKGRSGEVYNIGAETEYPNIEVVEKLLRLTGRDKKSIHFVPDRLGHDFRYFLDISKIQKLGWKPKVSFEEGLKRTLAFYRSK